MKIIPLKTVEREELLAGLAFGLLAGLAFALSAWLSDALALANANAYYPWIKLIIGGIPAILVGVLVGWLAVRIDSILLRLLTWTLTGLLYTWWASHVPFEGFYTVLGILSPAVQKMVAYPFVINAATRAVIAMLVGGGVGFGAGLLQTMLSDSVLNADSPFGKALPVLFWMAIFAVAGLTTNNLINQQLRDPVVAMDQLVQFSLDNEGKQVSPQVARDMHVGSLNAIQAALHQPRKLILSKYDDLMTMTEVLINFGGSWARCSVINSEEGISQPSYCELVQ